VKEYVNKIMSKGSVGKSKEKSKKRKSESVNMGVINRVKKRVSEQKREYAKKKLRGKN
jgi:hypothetical protein